MFFNALPELVEDLKYVSSELEKLIMPDVDNGAVGEIIKDTLATRGKGYRPSLLILCARSGCGFEENKPDIYCLSAIVELVHIASLIHDDIIDNSRLRRNKRTVQDKYGKVSAVYAGDLILGQVMNILMQRDLKEYGVMIANTIKDMCKGEITQFSFRYNVKVTEEDYYKSVYGKTVSMFVSVCKIGAMLGKCNLEQIEIFKNIGYHLGYLFQIRDDLLDFVNGNVADGKTSHIDFKDGVLTLPIIHSLKDTSVTDDIKNLVLKAKKHELEDTDFIKLEDLIFKAKGFDYAAARAKHHLNEVNKEIGALENQKIANVLRSLISKLTLPKIR